jgi:hypothetical protein
MEDGAIFSDENALGRRVCIEDAIAKWQASPDRLAALEIVSPELLFSELFTVEAITEESSFFSLTTLLRFFRLKHRKSRCFRVGVIMFSGRYNYPRTTG